MPDPAPPAASFPYHRSVAPMMWLFVSIAGVELLVVHLLVGLKWPRAAWVLSLLTAGAIVWLVAAIRSFTTCPHRLEGDRLILAAGRLKRADLALSDVATIRSRFSGDELRDGARNFALIAYPNRLVVTRGESRNIGIRLDDSHAFDAALRARGVDLEGAGA